MPSGSDVVREDDVLAVVGSRESVESARAILSARLDSATAGA
jgi:hypothetical protein